MIRSGRLLVVVLPFVAAAACGPQINLAKLTPTEVSSGWYDDGVKDGLNYLKPSISFRLQNTDTVPATEVQLTVSFWQDGADGENDSLEVVGIGSDALAPGESGAPILVRAPHGYTIEQPRAELFQHSAFKDFTAKIFAKRNGHIVPIGNFKIERRILPHVTAAAGPP
jgi:hypothetical protein